MRVENHELNMISMLKYFILRNKLLLGVLFASVLGTWYAIIEINASGSAIESESEISEIKSQITALNEKADGILKTGNSSRAVHILDECLRLAKGNDFDSLQVEILKKKASIQEEAGNVEGAIYSYLTILEIAKTNNNIALKEVRKKLGTIYSNSSYNAGVIELFMPVLENPNLKEEYGDANLHLVTAYLNIGNMDSSLHYINQAEKTILPNNSRQQSALLLSRAYYNLNLGQFSKAIGYLDSSEIISKFSKDTIGLSQIHFVRANLSYLNDDFQRVISETKKSITFLEKLNDGENLRSAYKNIAGAYGEMGDLKNENYYYRKANDLEEDMKSNKKGKTASDFASNFKHQWKSDELARLSEERHLLQMDVQSKQRQKYLLIAILILICFLFVYGFRLFWSKQKQYKLSEEVLERDKHLLRKELEIVRKKVEYDSQLISEKEELIATLEEKLTDSAFEENEQKELLLMIESMKDGLKQERDNIGMEILLKEDNDKFYKRLKEKHPDVSQTEARFCTLLYINLDTKEIARILNISLDGVRKGRHRLRHKLDLQKGANVTKYLQSI